MEYFDYRAVARSMHVPPAVLKTIIAEVRRDFPRDRMMFELHVMRAVRSGYWRTRKAAGTAALQVSDPPAEYTVKAGRRP
ncbi:MAG: hypothetical protein ABIF71_13255 [Planctomycetota bacterium]